MQIWNLFMARNQDLSKLRYKQTQHPNLAPERYSRYVNPNHLASIRKVNPLMTAQANKLARNFLAINRQMLELESCSNPLGIQQVF